MESEAHRKLVVKLEIKLTMPEQVLLRQEDLPEINPLDDNVGEDSAGEVIKEPKMYFIAKGKYDVYI